MRFTIAITIVGVLAAAAPVLRQTLLPPLRHLQFRLRTLLIAVAMFAVSLAFVRWLCFRYVAISVIRSSASDYEYDWIDPIGIASYEGTGIGDEDLKTLRWYFEHHPYLVTLDLSGTNVSDQGIACLSRLRNLRWLKLQNTKVTDDGVNRLQLALPELNVERE